MKRTLALYFGGGRKAKVNVENGNIRICLRVGEELRPVVAGILLSLEKLFIHSYITSCKPFIVFDLA